MNPPNWFIFGCKNLDPQNNQNVLKLLYSISKHHIGLDVEIVLTLSCRQKIDRKPSPQGPGPRTWRARSSASTSCLACIIAVVSGADGLRRVSKMLDTLGMDYLCIYIYTHTYIYIYTHKHTYLYIYILHIYVSWDVTYNLSSAQLCNPTAAHGASIPVAWICCSQWPCLGLPCRKYPIDSGYYTKKMRHQP